MWFSIPLDRGPHIPRQWEGLGFWHELIDLPESLPSLTLFATIHFHFFALAHTNLFSNFDGYSFMMMILLCPAVVAET